MRLCHAVCLLPVCVYRSVNEVICHGIPDLRPFQNGDIVNLDVTVYHRGHHADLNETYFIGEVDPESVKLVETAYACLAAAVEMCTCLAGVWGSGAGPALWQFGTFICPLPLSPCPW